MAFKRDFKRNFRQNREIDLDQAAAYLKDVVAKIKANPDELEALRKVFKKSVPFTMRSWVAAFLLKNAGGSIARFSFHKDREEIRAARDSENRRVSRDEKSADDTSAEGKERFTRVEIDPDQAASVFVGIGRNRRVYPRDLVGLFISVAGIDKERIGNISVLANYSFVQLFKEDAEKAINALNGYNYRGRALSVSYSRHKDEEGAEGVEAENEASIDSYENNEPVPNVSNASAPIVDSFTSSNSDTMAQQAAFAKAQAEMTDEEILAARAPRSSSSEDIQ